MKDPYTVLGISKNATDDEVKSAYRELAKKYHPDRFTDDSMAEIAAEKMKEINEAYDTIINSRKHKKNGSYANGWNGGQYNPNSKFADIRSYISQNRFEDAQALLDGVPISDRDAEWYYLDGIVCYRRGWYDAAYTNLNTACRMDPQNPEYREAFARIQNSRAGFGRGADYRRGTGDCSGCDVCSSLICADCCCEAMGGDLIRCC